MATYYQRFANGNNANDGLSFANAKKDWFNIAAGDTLRMIGCTAYRVQTAALVDVNATFVNKGDTLTLSAAVTAHINQCATAFTAATNVTCGTDGSQRKEGLQSCTVSPASAFTTGKAAHAPCATTDLSAYTKVSFWLRPSAAVVANTIRFRLCSDTSGNTVVHQFTIDWALQSSVWQPIVFDNGAALSSNIQSISIEYLVDPGTTSLFLDNIVACHPTGLTHRSVWGKSSSSTSTDRWATRSIDGVTIKLDAGVNSNIATASRGYYGTSETVALYAVEPEVALASQTITSNLSGSTTGVVSGGWNRTDMSTQDSLTWLWVPSNITVGLSGVNVNYENLLLVHGGVSTTSNYSTGTITKCGGINSSGSGFTVGTDSLVTYQNCLARQSATGFGVGGTSSLYLTFIGCRVDSCTGVGFSMTGSGFREFSVQSLESYNNGSFGIQYPATGYGEIHSPIIADNAAAGIHPGSGAGADIKLFNPTSSNNVAFVQKVTNHRNFDCWGGSSSDTDLLAGTGITGYRIRLHAWGGDQQAHRHYEEWGFGECVAASSWVGTGHTPTGRVWRFTPANEGATNSTLWYKHDFELAILPAGTYTFALKTYRNTTTVRGKLVVKGGRLDGVSSDTSSSLSAAAVNTTETLSVTVTTSETGPIQLQLWTQYTTGSTGSVYIDEMTIT